LPAILSSGFRLLLYAILCVYLAESSKLWIYYTENYLGSLKVQVFNWHLARKVMVYWNASFPDPCATRSKGLNALGRSKLVIPNSDPTVVWLFVFFCDRVLTVLSHFSR
jgi:hypothetical protein